MRSGSTDRETTQASSRTRDQGSPADGSSCQSGPPKTPRMWHHRPPPYGPGIAGSGEANVSFLFAASAPLYIRAAKQPWVQGPHEVRGVSCQQAVSPLLCQARLKHLPLECAPCTCFFPDAPQLVLGAPPVPCTSQANHSVSYYLRRMGTPGSTLPEKGVLSGPKEQTKPWSLQRGWCRSLMPGSLLQALFSPL